MHKQDRRAGSFVDVVHVSAHFGNVRNWLSKGYSPSNPVRSFIARHSLSSSQQEHRPDESPPIRYVRRTDCDSQSRRSSVEQSAGEWRERRSRLRIAVDSFVSLILHRQGRAAQWAMRHAQERQCHIPDSRLRKSVALDLSCSVWCGLVLNDSKRCRCCCTCGGTQRG